MRTRPLRRGDVLARQRGPKSQPSKDSFFKKRCKDIQDGKLIPIIGDTIRNAHIFDHDADQNLGVETAENRADSFIDYDKLNVTEELTQSWANGGTYLEGKEEPITYPLTDNIRIARVAQFYALVHNEPLTAKEDYLSFLKDELIGIAYDVAEMKKDNEEMAFIQQLAQESTLSYSDLVTELDYPQFPEGQEDPLQILARLPIKVYITTSYHDFIERELEAAGKHPQSRLCFWNMAPENLAPEHRPHPDYKPDKNHPVVYHLLGMEQYPASMVLSEDDYLDLLWAIARDEKGQSHNGDSIIPPYFEHVLKESSLLLLGYRLHDWDLKVLFRGLLRGDEGFVKRRRSSTAIHIDLDEQPMINDKEKDRKQAEKYIKSYFKQASFDVKFSRSDDFINALWQEWLEWIGAKS